MSRLSPKALRLYDELGLLVPARVDPDTGYRWYAVTQLDQARLVASLRRIRVPLIRIRDILALDTASAAEEIRAYWAGTEAEHAAQRELVGHLAARLHGEKSAMYEATVRDMPARSLLSVTRRVHQDEVLAMGRELFIHRLLRGGVPRIAGVAGAPFTIYYGEVSGDSDGPGSGAAGRRPSSPSMRWSPGPQPSSASRPEASRCSSSSTPQTGRLDRTAVSPCRCADLGSDLKLAPWAIR